MALRHTRLTARQQAHQALYAGMPLGKGSTRVDVAKGKREAHSARVEAVRADVMARAKGHCECCSAKATLQMDERVSRAKTRGMRPEWRFDVKWCLGLCQFCHERLTWNRLVCLFSSLELGANGGVDFVAADEVENFPALFTAKQVWEHATGRKLG